MSVRRFQIGNAMMSSPAEEDEPLHATDDPETTTKKSERKRQREKQRRSDLANAFDELGALMAKIEPEDLDDSGNSRKRKRGKSTDSHDADQGDSSGMTRLDLIGRTIETIRRLHRENAELKHNLEEMRRKAGDEKVRPLTHEMGNIHSFSIDCSVALLSYFYSTLPDTF